LERPVVRVQWWDRLPRRFRYFHQSLDRRAIVFSAPFDPALSLCLSLVDYPTAVLAVTTVEDSGVARQRGSSGLGSAVSPRFGPTPGRPHQEQLGHLFHPGSSDLPQLLPGASLVLPGLPADSLRPAGGFFASVIWIGGRLIRASPQPCAILRQR